MALQGVTIVTGRYHRYTYRQLHVDIEWYLLALFNILARFSQRQNSVLKFATLTYHFSPNTKFDNYSIQARTLTLFPRDH